MNTPTHAIFAYAIGKRGIWNKSGRALALGGVMPDVPMFVFYIWAKGTGHAESEIWNTVYFDSSWQLVFDLFHSIPIAIAAMLVFMASNRHRLAAFFGAAILHCIFDLLLHHDDGHRHFLPLSSFIFNSPVSYWDPAHNGRIGAGFELIIFSLSTIFIFQRESKAIFNLKMTMLLTLNVAFATAYAYIYWLR